jgi:tetratricopeptide (TPR) repeat protein
MFGPEVQDALRTRWRSMMNTGRALDVLAEIEAQLDVDSLNDCAFLLCWQATAYNHLGTHAKALESAQKALQTSVNIDDPRTTALIHANIGIASQYHGAPIDNALNSFEIAERILRELGDEWTLGAVFINHAVYELSRGAIGSGLALLEKASSCSPVSEAEREEEPNRALTIRINRSAALFASGKTKESIEELLQARQAVLQAGNPLLLGIVDFNLSGTYERLQLYGSMIEAAESAADNYVKAGSASGTRRARAMVAAGLAYLGKQQQAQDLVDELLSAADGEETEQVLADLSVVAEAFRKQGFGDIYNLQERPYGMLTEQVSAILNRLQVLKDQNYAGAAYAESEDLLSQLDAFDHPGVHLIADFERAVRTAHIDPDNPLPSEVFKRQGQMWSGRPRDTKAIVRMIVAMKNEIAAIKEGKEHPTPSYFSSLTDRLNSWLEGLWDLHESWHEQHHETYRSEFLSGRRHQELAVALDVAVEAAKPEVIMEIIETFRIDVSHSGTAQARFGLASFGQLAEATSAATHPGGAESDSSVTRAARYLIDPRPVAVRGKSAIVEAASLPQQPADLDLLRVALAGQDALWWSFAILDETLYWALLTPGSVHGGKRKLPATFVSAVGAHLNALPISLASDLALFNNSSEPAVTDLIALARCASNALLNRSAIREKAVAALPAHLQSSVREYCATVGQIDIQGPYELLAQVLLPEELRQALRTADHNCRLIVTVPPELATLPIGLLPVDADSVLLDHAYVQFSPPAGLAAGFVGRPAQDTPRPHLLSVVDTIGDLGWATRPTSQTTPVLTGWSTARLMSDVATRRRVTEELRHGGWMGGASGVFSYIGHVVPGDRDRPASAALICAPTGEDSPPDLLTAGEILSWKEQCFPSHVYLGGCEGTGFGTGLEWASVAAAALARGASCVLAHAWPIVDSVDMAEIDEACAAVLAAEDVGHALGEMQRSWMDQWRHGLPNAIPPHFWAGLQLIGCAGPQPGPPAPA